MIHEEIISMNINENNKMETDMEVQQSFSDTFSSKEKNSSDLQIENNIIWTPKFHGISDQENQENNSQLRNSKRNYKQYDSTGNDYESELDDVVHSINNTNYYVIQNSQGSHSSIQKKVENPYEQSNSTYFQRKMKVNPK